MTYSEFCELREKLTKAEEDYKKAWEEHDGSAKAIRKVRRLADTMCELEEKIIYSSWYK